MIWDNEVLLQRREEFMRRKDFGSPVPANEILLPFQKDRRRSIL